MIVDAHLHLFRNGYPRTKDAPALRGLSDVDAYEGLMARHGIAAGLVVCYEAEGIDPDNNGYVRELAKTRPWIASLAFLPPEPAPTTEAVDTLLVAGHCGITAYLPDATAAQALLSWPRAVWERLARSRAIVSLNARPEAIAALQPLLERTPGCQFLFSHLGLPGPYARLPSREEAKKRLAPLLQLASLPNVGVKISGLYAVDAAPPHPLAKPFIDLLFEHFSPENLHWASDFSPVLEFTGFRDTLLEDIFKALPQQTRVLVEGEGLARRIAQAGAR